VVASIAAMLAEPGRAPRAIASMLLGSALITLNDGLVKVLTSGYPVGQLLMMRGLFVLPWIILFAYWTESWKDLRVGNLAGQGLRAFCVVISSFAFVTGLIYLPLADAIAVAFTGPLFITALAPLVLKEVVGWRRWAAVLVGFSGVLLMVRPGQGTVQLAVLFPMAAACAGGLRDLITRRISNSVSSSGVLLFTTLTVIAAGLATTPFAWQQVRLADLGIFAASGALIAGGQYMMIEAFRHGEAAMVAPFKYTTMVWAVLFGFLLFGDLPGAWTLSGTAFVICAGLYILHRETRIMRRPLSAGPRPPMRL
jgi:drug/metabolite transporter (DMT)-like permease